MTSEVRILAFGNKGKIGFCGNLAEVRAEDKRIKISGTGFTNLTDYAEANFDFEPEVVEIPHEADPDQFLKEWLTGIYESYGKYGPFGDYLLVIRRRREFVLVMIAPKAFHKPGVAADLVPVIVDRGGRKFFVGIRRGQEPGKGRTSLLGGFMDIQGMHFENAVQCLVHEGAEEIGAKIKLLNRTEINASITPFPPLAQVSVEFTGNQYPAEMKLVNVIYTGHEEELPALNQKRVHFTAVYVMQVRVDADLSVAEIEANFIPQDLAEGNKVVVFEIGVNDQQFGLGHHQTAYDLAVGMIS